MDQLPQELFHGFGIFQHRLLLGIVGGPAAFPVRAGHGGAQLTTAEGLALHRIPGGSRQLLVLGGKLGDAGLLLLSAGMEPVIQRQQAAQLRPEGLVHRRGIGAFRNGHRQGLAVQRLQPGQGLLKLRLVKFVSHVVERAYGRDALAQGHLLLEGVPLPNHVQQLLRTGGSSGPAGQLVIPRLKGIHIRTGIENIGKLPILVHQISPSC